VCFFRLDLVYLVQDLVFVLWVLDLMLLDSDPELLLNWCGSLSNVRTVSNLTYVSPP
jgi:hypothetical protein